MDPQTYGQLTFDKAGKNLQWHKDSLFSERCWENWTAMQKNEPGPLSYTIHENKFKMGVRPKCKTGSHKNPWGESRQKLFDLGHSNFLLNTSQEARETKAKINYWDLIKIKLFYTAKETSSKTKRQPTEWEMILANKISDKGLVSKI